MDHMIWPSRTSYFSSMAFVLGEQRSEIKTKNLRTGTRNLEFQDGEDVDGFKQSGNSLKATALMIARIVYVCKTVAMIFRVIKRPQHVPVKQKMI